MTNFFNSVRAGYQQASGEDVTFYSVAEAEAFFREHWHHGASNEGDLLGTITCEACGQEWTYTGRGLRSGPRRSSTSAYLDNDRHFL